MDHRTDSIGYLKKVVVSLEWNGKKAPLEFISGVSSRGLCPFEAHLWGKGPGYECEFRPTREELNRLFDHLLPYLPRIEVQEVFTLRVQVVRVDQADQREVIRAMAEASSCSSHCCGH